MLNSVLSFPEVRETSDWTAWVKSNVTREGHIETRYQSVCVASVQGPHQIRSRMKTKIRFCPAGKNQCNGDDPDDRYGNGPGNHGDSYDSNQLPVKGGRGDDHVVNMVEKHCKKLGYARLDDGVFSNRVNPLGGDSSNSILTEKQLKYVRRYGLSAGGRVPKDRNQAVKPEVYKINPSDHTTVETRRAGLTHSRAFQGFCGCRDMGNLRMCYRCRQNPNQRQSGNRLVKAGSGGTNTKRKRVRSLKNLKNKKKKIGPSKKVSPAGKKTPDNKKDNSKKGVNKKTSKTGVSKKNNNNKKQDDTKMTKKKMVSGTSKRQAELRKLARRRHRLQPAGQAIRAKTDLQTGSRPHGARQGTDRLQRQG